MSKLSDSGQGRQTTAPRRRHSGAAIAASLLFAALAAAAATAETFDSDGVEIFYLDEGEGAPVLLIHGFTASARMNWGVNGILKGLSSGHRVVALDNRGHGYSDKPQTAEAYGAEMVADAVRLLDHLKIEKAHVVGYSMGGMITLKMAATHPERMLSAVIGGMGWTRLDDDTRQRYEGSSAPQTSPALSACFRRFWELGITEKELAAIAVPMTVLIGTEDGLLQRSVEPFMKVRPDVPIVRIEGASHTSAVFKPEFRDGIRRFIEAHALSE